MPFYQKPIISLEEESLFTHVMSDLVRTHSNTIPTLAQGFLECRKYINPADVTKFLERHLRARIGTRLIAEQHLALHLATKDAQEREGIAPNHIGVIDTALRPANVLRSCENFVAEICELKYGVRPSLLINGEVDAQLAHVPVHLEYILTELLKNAFRATIESQHEREPVEVTIAAAPDVPMTSLDALKTIEVNGETSHDFTAEGLAEYCLATEGVVDPLNPSTQNITIRIRDRGGGISPDVLPNIWSYSFTTFSNEEAIALENGNVDGINTIAASGQGNSSIAGLGYGLPLSRAYAEYFGGGIAVQSMFGWGTDVYLSLQGLGKVV